MDLNRRIKNDDQKQHIFHEINIYYHAANIRSVKKIELFKRWTASSYYSVLMTTKYLINVRLSHISCTWKVCIGGKRNSITMELTVVYSMMNTSVCARHTNA
jgi:hypothetical protein